MAKEVKIPQISEDAESATVEEVMVSKGDTIEKDQSIIALSTDKASVEVPSSDTGKVKEVKVKEGDEVKVGDVVLILEEEDDGEDDSEEKEDSGEDREEDKGKEDDSEKQEKEEGKKDKSKDKNSDKPDKEVDEEGEKDEQEEEKEEKSEDQQKEKKTDQSGDSEVAASPSVRRIARELGIDIAEVTGSGPGDRISQEDVKSHAEGGQEKKASTSLQLPDFSQWGKVEREKLSSIRKATAKNVTASWQSIPHVFQFDQADISGIQEYIDKNSEKVEKAGGKLTITAILLKIVASALQQFPKFNGSVDMENEEMILKKYIHIGLAADTEKGLLVPVVRDVNTKSIVELSVEITELAEKAREQKLKAEEMEGGNFTISNLGGIGGTNFTPIIYHPQVAILGVSRAEMKPVYINGKFEPRQILPLSLSYDHRMIDGAEGAEFLRWIGNAMEDPYKALLGA